MNKERIAHLEHIIGFFGTDECSPGYLDLLPVLNMIHPVLDQDAFLIVKDVRKSEKTWGKDCPNPGDEEWFRLPWEDDRFVHHVSYKNDPILNSENLLSCKLIWELDGQYFIGYNGWGFIDSIDYHLVDKKDIKLI